MSKIADEYQPIQRGLDAARNALTADMRAFDAVQRMSKEPPRTVAPASAVFAVNRNGNDDWTPQVDVDPFEVYYVG